MQTKDIMSTNVVFVEPTASVQDAALLMRELDCGFLPVGDMQHKKLSGVITDRDIAVRMAAEGLSPKDTTVDSIKSDAVYYCFEDEDISSPADKMREQQVYRLVVLNNAEEKKLSGIVTLNDLVRHDQLKLSSRTAREIGRSAIV